MATVSIEGPEKPVAEGDNATFTVTLSGGLPTEAVTVDYATAAVTAMETDFTLTAGTLSFAAGATGDDLTQTFDVKVLTDDQVEGNETFTATLSANTSSPLPTGFTLGTSSATATIAANGTATVSITGPASPVNEGESATFIMALSASPGTEVRVNCVTLVAANDTAQETDFTMTSISMTFPANADGTMLRQEIEVPVMEDGLTEDAETFTMRISAPAAGLPAGFSLGTPPTAQATIIANGMADEKLSDLNNRILPEVARALADQTVGAIAKRIGQAGTGARSVSLAGQSNWAEVASAHGQGMADGTLDMKDMLGNSEFALPLNIANAADSADGVGGGSSLTFWGAGDFRHLDDSSDDVDFDGDLFSGHLGVDGKPRADLLIGLAASWNEVDLNYHNSDLVGEYQLDLISLHPYANWEALAGRLNLWATAGYGQGDIEITDDGQGRASSDVVTRTLAAGGDYQLQSHGATTFRLKGSALLTELEVEGGDGIAAMEVEASLLRVVLEGSHKQMLSDGAYIEPSFEAGARYDGGDGATGVGVELGVGLRYTNPVIGLTVDGKARTLVGRDDYEEWGVSGRILLEPGSNGRGFSFSLKPVYGSTDSGTQALWREGLRDYQDGTARDHRMRMEMRLGYGLTAPDGYGLLTPYAEMTSGDSTRRYRLGMSWEMDPLFDLNLFGECCESSSGVTSRSILLRGRVRF